MPENLTNIEYWQKLVDIDKAVPALAFQSALQWWALIFLTIAVVILFRKVKKLEKKEQR